MAANSTCQEAKLHSDGLGVEGTEKKTLVVINRKFSLMAGIMPGTRSIPEPACFFYRSDRTHKARQMIWLR